MRKLNGRYTQTNKKTLSTLQCQLKCRREWWDLKVNHHSNNCLRLESLIDAKTNRWVLNEKHYFHSLKVLILSNYKGHSGNFMVEKTCRHWQSQVMKVDNTINNSSRYNVPTDLICWKGHIIISEIFLTETYNSNIVTRKLFFQRQRLKDILQKCQGYERQRLRNYQTKGD